MVHTPKNTVKGHTESFKRMRAREIKYYQDNPFVGLETAGKMYEALKKVIPSIIHVSHCGPIICFVTYKKDMGAALTIMSRMLNKPPHQKVCELTGFIKTFIINH